MREAGTALGAFEEWIASPTREGYAKLLDAVRSEPRYDATRHLAEHVVPLLEAGRYVHAERMLLEVFSAHVLSPSAHALLARCHDGLGEPDRAREERRLMELTMQALLHAGDGTELRPYPVVILSDEYDALDVLNIEPSTHLSREVGDDVLDTFEDASGRRVHFLLRGGARRAAS